MKHWHQYLQGQQFILETDHRPLEALMQKTQLNSKCERWRLLLQTYDLTVKHIPGASNNMPDYLSRSPVDPPSDDLDDAPDLSIVTTLPAAVSPPSVNVVTTRSRARQTSTLPTDSSPSHSTSDLLSLPPPAVSPPATANASDELRIDFTGDLAMLRVAQASDQSLRFIIDHVNEPRFVKNCKVLDDILMHFEAGSKPVLCVPAGKLRRDIMRIYHDTLANGAHFGRDKTLRKIRDRYYWDSMTNDITNYVRSCLRCRENNPVRRKPAGHLKPIVPPKVSGSYFPWIFMVQLLRSVVVAIGTLSR